MMDRVEGLDRVDRSRTRDSWRHVALNPQSTLSWLIPSHRARRFDLSHLGTSSTSSEGWAGRSRSGCSSRCCWRGQRSSSWGHARFGPGSGSRRYARCIGSASSPADAASSRRAASPTPASASTSFACTAADEPWCGGLSAQSTLHHFAQDSHKVCRVLEGFVVHAFLRIVDVCDRLLGESS